ncbi:hypothetical protein CW705_07935, partial [Candidatus Bathyarchaeota archaeon]
GYVQGQINPDFYYKYHLTLTKSNDLNSILDMLNKTNTRYIIFRKGQEFPSIYEDKRFFDKIRAGKFIIFKLKDDYPLNFIDFLAGKAILNYSYLNPDRILIKAWYCSKNVTLSVKMNYYPGWTAHSTSGEVKLIRDHDGLMIIQLLNAYSADITLQYGFTQIDYIGFAATTAGALTYLITFLSIIWKTHEGWTHTRHRGAYTDHIRKKKESMVEKLPEKISTKKVLKTPEKQYRGFPEFMMDAPLMAALATFSLYYIFPYLLTPGIPTPIDTYGHLFKVWYILDVLLKYGKVPVWCSLWYAGYPFLQFYPPLSYLLASLLGLILAYDSLKGFMVAIAWAYVASALFTYWGAKYLFKSRCAGVAASIAYTVSSIRSGGVCAGMFPFVVASAFLPLVIPATEKVLRKPSLKSYVFLASVLGCILLTHLQILFFAGLMIALYFFIRCIYMARSSVWNLFKLFFEGMRHIIIPIILTLGVTAFWFLPYYSFKSYFISGYFEYLREISGSLHDITYIIDRNFALKSGFGCYIGLSLISIILIALWIPRFKKDVFTIYFLLLSLLMAILSAYQIPLLKLAHLESLPFVSLIMPMRYLWVLTLSASFLFGGAVGSLSNTLVNKIFKDLRFRKFAKICILLIIILTVLLDFWPARERDFHVPYKVKSLSIYDEMRKDPEFYRVIITLEGDSIFAYSPAFHGKEIFDGYYIEGTPLREILYALRWITVHPERGKLLRPYFEMFSIKRFITHPHDPNLRFYLPTFSKRDFSFHTGKDYAYFELKEPVNFIKACLSVLYIGDPDDIKPIFESILLSRAPVVLIKGHTPYLDDYAMEELLRYNSICLYRWMYRDKSLAERLLRKYVERGGTAFIIPFYKGELLGRKFYLAKSTGNCSQGYFVNINSSYVDAVFHGVNTTDFAPAIYAGKPWHYIAISGPSEVLMWIDRNPVLAIDRIGKGKIVWIGFNLPVHVWLYLNPNEAQLIRNIIEYALHFNSEGWISRFTMEKRPYGYIEINLNLKKAQSLWLLIKEAYFPGWRASVNGVAVPLQTAEPGLITLKIGGSSSYKILLRYEYTEVHYAGWAITILTLIAIISMFLLKSRRLVKERSIRAAEKK